MTCSKLDRNTIMSIESLAKRNSGDDQIDPKNLEQTRIWFTTLSSQAANDNMYIREANPSHSRGRDIRSIYNCYECAKTKIANRKTKQPSEKCRGRQWPSSLPNNST